MRIMPLRLCSCFLGLMDEKDKSLGRAARSQGPLYYTLACAGLICPFMQTKRTLMEPGRPLPSIPACSVAKRAKGDSKPFKAWRQEEPTSVRRTRPEQDKA